MKPRIDKLSHWLLRPNDAADLFGSEQIIQDFRDAGWLTPAVCRKRLTLFDVVDLARCRELLRKHGDQKLKELARNGRSGVGNRPKEN